MRIVKAEEMAAIDRNTIEKIGIPGSVLMEKAGQTVFNYIVKHCGTVKGKRFLVLCGPGNNGGDGFVIARYLRESGAAVVCLSMNPLEKLKGDAQLYASVYTKLYGNFTVFVDCSQFEALLRESDYVVDALFGNGLDRNLKSPYSDLVKILNSTGAKVIAVDLPSGVDADNGQILGEAPGCFLTVSIGLPKWGLYLEPARSRSGIIEVADIGFPKRLLQAEDKEGDFIIDKALASSLLPLRPRQAHKGTFGTVWVIGGSAHYFGAPVLSAWAVLRSGAGMVLLAAPSVVCQKLGSDSLEIMRCSLKEGHGFLTEADLDCFAWLPNKKSEFDNSQNNRFNSADNDCPWTSPRAVCLGPGMGRRRQSTEFVRRLLEECSVPMVIDADALWHLKQLEAGQSLNLQKRCVLTPHLGELSRLLDISIEDLQKNLPYYARLCSNKYNCIAVVKGSPTIISDGQRCWLSCSGGPILAQGGSGDVLAGLISGILAQGVEPFLAASLGAFWHGTAADLAAEKYADRGKTASEICNLLPEAARILQIDHKSE
ncbi:MAG: NAD(P)H-hydrate dehydratase [Candidatus Bruticola sp.]